MKNLHKYFDDLNLKALALGYLMVCFLGFMSISTYINHQKGISIAENYETEHNEAWANAFGDDRYIENEEHPMGILLNTTDTLNLYHPLIWFVIFVLFSTLIVMMNIAYIQQQKLQKLN